MDCTRGFIKNQGEVLGPAGSTPESILIPTYDKKLLLEGRCVSTRGSMSRSLTFTVWDGCLWTVGEPAVMLCVE